MSLIFLSELREQQDHRCQQALCGVIEKCVLAIRCTVTAADIDDGFRRDLGIFFCFCLCGQISFVRKVDVHVLVDKVQDIVLVRSCRIAQINHRHIVSIVFLCNLTVISRNIALRVGIQKRHPGSEGKFDIRVQKIRRLADTGSADHKRMHIALVNQSDRVFLAPTPHDRTLHFRQVLSSAPFLRLKWQKGKSVFHFFLRSPSSRSVLPIAHSFALDRTQAASVKQMHHNHENCKQSDHNTHRNYLFIIQILTSYLNPK